MPQKIEMDNIKAFFSCKKQIHT